GRGADELYRDRHGRKAAAKPGLCGASAGQAAGEEEVRADAQADRAKGRPRYGGDQRSPAEHGQPPKQLSLARTALRNPALRSGGSPAQFPSNSQVTTEGYLDRLGLGQAGAP